VTTRPGGFGRQGFGPFGFGLGGPLTVVRCLAVAGQVVRVVYDEEPLHRSPAGASDALNPSNYIFTVPGANATAPVPVGVDTTMVVGPAYGVGNGSGPGVADERGFDVHTDRQLIVGVVYNVRVRNVQSALGGLLGSPDNGNFGGVTLLQETKVPARNQDLVDIRNPPSAGHWVVDDSGDIAPEDPDAGTRKRVFRRLSTPENAFRFLKKGYGAGLALKAPGSIAELAARKVRALQQLRQEPDVADASLSMTIQPNGLTIVSARVKTRRGSFIDIGATVTAVGQMSGN
jgi:hypothetical protein